MLTGRKLALTLAFTVLVALAAGVSCGKFFQSPTITSFTITPQNPTVLLGGTQQMYAWGTNSNGQTNINITGQVTWMSSSADINITAGGQMTGVSLGTSATPVTISATYEGDPAQTTNATVCVDTGSNLTISPTGAYTWNNGDATTQDFTATVDYTVDGVTTTPDVTASVQWTSTNTAALTMVDGTDPAVATITPPIAGSAAATGTLSGTYTCNGVLLNATNPVSFTINPSTD